MSKFCVKCGKEMPKESKFCPKCGNEVEGSNSSTENKKILPAVICGGIAVAVVVIVIILIANLGEVSLKNITNENSSKNEINKNSPESEENDNNLESDTDKNSPESVALEFCNAGYKGDINKVIELMLPGEYDTLPADDKEDIEVGMKEYAGISKYTCEYESKDKVTGDYLDEYKDGLKEYYGVDISKISEVYVVNLNVTEKNAYNDSSSEDYYVVKSGNKYYIDWYGSFYIIKSLGSLDLSN